MIILLSVCYSNNSETKENLDTNNENAKSEFPKELRELQLNIAVVLTDKATSPSLAFIVKNNSKVDITIPEFREGHNRIEIINPDGKSYGAYSEWGGIARQIKINSSESMIWFMDTARILDNRLYPEEGLYRIKWKIYNVESKEFLLLKETAKDKSKTAASELKAKN